MITERPAEATDRAIRWHGQGDLIMAKGFTSLGRLSGGTTLALRRSDSPT